MFKRNVIYYLYPPFNGYIDTNDITIIQRYIYAQFFYINQISSVNFTVEEICEFKNMKFVRHIFTDNYNESILPNNLQIILNCLTKDEVVGSTAELFVQSLFHDIILSRLDKNKWVEKYFPEWKRIIDSEHDPKKNIIEDLKEIQRRILNGDLRENC